MKKIKLSAIATYSSLSSNRLDQVLAKLFKEYSRSYLKKLIYMNQVLVDGNIVNQPDKKILGGENIIIYLYDKDISYNIPENIPENIHLNIIYEDNDILVINKPAGLVIHPGAGNHKGTILNALLYHYKNVQNLPRAGIVHRLDKDTSGLIVIAKNIFAYNYLLKLLKKRKIIRKYQGIVTGCMISGGMIDRPIMRHNTKRIQMMVHNSGKKSVTYYKIITRFKCHTHVEIKLETGRTHQIRVHMLYIKYPLVGDPVYSGINRSINYNHHDSNIKKIYKFPRQALHASYLSLKHPVTKKLMSWMIPLPQDMQELLTYL